GVHAEGQRDHRELQAGEILDPGRKVRRGAPSLRRRPAARRDARARRRPARRARGPYARRPRRARRRGGRARLGGLLRGSGSRPRARGRPPDRRRRAAGPDRPALPGSDLALLQPRRLRGGPARRACLGGGAAGLRRRRDARAAGLGRSRCGAAARVVRTPRTDSLQPHRDNNSPEEEFMKRMTWLVVLAALAVVGGFRTAPALSQSKVVKIGDLGSKVGVFEGYGKYQTMGMQLAVDELNAKGGVLGNRIEIVSEDDETKPAPAVRKAEKLILQDDVKLLVGAVSSGATMAVMDVTKKHKTIHWNSVSCAEFMRTTKFHKYYFSNQPDSRMQANGLAKYIVDKMGKKVYVFYTDYAMGQSDGRQFKTALEKIGGEVVGVAGAP